MMKNASLIVLAILIALSSAYATTDGLEAYYSFDTSCYYNDLGNASRNATLGAGSVAHNTTSYALGGGSCSFTNIESELFTNYVDNDDNLTACGWFELNQYPQDDAWFFGSRVDSGTYQRGLLFSSNTNTTHLITRVNGNRFAKNDSVSINLNEWYYACMVSEVIGANANIYQYVNGELVASNTTTYNPNTEYNEFLMGAVVGLFASPAEDSLLGQLDEVTFYNRPLIGSEISNLYEGSGDPFYCNPNTTSTPCNGTGTVGDPYIITTPNELNATRNNMTAFYELGNDIDMAGFTPWVPIGSWAAGDYFTGSLDGKGYSIDNLHFTWTDPTYEYPAGLFGATNNPTNNVSAQWFRNINMHNFSFATNDTYDDTCCIGSLIGSIDNELTLENIYVEGTFDARYTGDVGGITGYATNGMIARNITFVGDVYGGGNTGGVFGGAFFPAATGYNHSNFAFIGNIYHNVTVDATSRAGGILSLAGNENFVLQDSYAIANISVLGGATSCGTYCDYGGIVGWSGSLTQTLRNAYFYGSLPNQSAITNSHVGYIAGSGSISNGNFSTCDGVYYGSDVENTVSIYTGCPTGQEAVGLTDVEMYDEASFPEFDFVTVWAVDYLSTPKFLWQPVTPVPVDTCPGIASGTGTAGDPCIVTTPSEFNAMRNNITAYYELGNDIDMAGATWDGPIGDWAVAAFSGAFDGNNHTVSNMHWTWTDPTYEYPAGIFGVLDTDKWMRNVNFDNYSLIFLDDYATTGCCGGGFIGGDDSSTTWEMSNVHFTNSFIDMRNTGHVGGVVGYSGNAVGGNLFKNVSFEGDVYIGYSSGGITSYQVDFEDTYFIGNIYYNSSAWPGHASYIGGIFGHGSADGAYMNNTYVVANISSLGGDADTNSVGGLGGMIRVFDKNYTIENSYFYGSLPSNVSFRVDMIGNKWLSDTYNIVCNNVYYGADVPNTADNNCTGGGATGLTDAQFYDEGSLTGFDFVTVWAVDYLSTPKFLWQDFTPVPAVTEVNITGCIDLQNDTNYYIQSDLQLDGSTGSNPSTYVCILGNNVHNVTIDGQGFTINETNGGQNWGLFGFFNSNDIVVKNVNTDDNWYAFISSGFALTGPVDDIQILNNTGTGIQFDKGLTNAIIDGNNMTWPADAAYDYSPTLTLLGNGVTSESLRVENITVTNNYIANEYATQGYELLLLKSGAPGDFAYNFLFDNNTFRQVDGPVGAIKIGQSSGNGLVNVTFTNNFIYSKEESASPSGKYTYNNTIENNTWTLVNGSGFSETCTNDGSGFCTETYVNAIGPAFEDFWGWSDTNDTHPVALTAAYSFDITECRQLTQPGYYTLTTNIAATSGDTTNGYCIEILVDDVVIDGDGYSLTADGTIAGDEAIASEKSNLTVRNITIDGEWSYSIDFQTGSEYTLIEDTVLTSPVYLWGSAYANTDFYFLRNHMTNPVGTNDNFIEYYSHNGDIVLEDNYFYNNDSTFTYDLVYIQNSNEIINNMLITGNTFITNSSTKDVFDLSMIGSAQTINFTFENNYVSEENHVYGDQNLTGVVSVTNNTWTNFAGTGHSDTCTNDGFGVCVEEYAFDANVNDTAPVALSPDIYITSCREITQSGNYTILNDILAEQFDCIVANSVNDVVIDGAGYTITLAPGYSEVFTLSGNDSVIENVNILVNETSSYVFDFLGGSTIVRDSNVTMVEVDTADWGAIAQAYGSVQHPVTFDNVEVYAGGSGSVHEFGYFKSNLTIINSHIEMGTFPYMYTNPSTVVIDNSYMSTENGLASSNCIIEYDDAGSQGGFLTVTNSILNVTTNVPDEGDKPGMYVCYYTPSWNNATTVVFNNNTYVTANADGFSETCTNDGSGVCVEDYTIYPAIDGAIDNSPVALTPSYFITECGVVSLPGTYTVIANLTSSGYCIDVTASGVTIDIGEYHVTGGAAIHAQASNLVVNGGVLHPLTMGGTGHTVGIHAEAISGLTVNGTTILGGTQEIRALTGTTSNFVIDNVTFSGGGGTGSMLFYRINGLTVKDSEFYSTYGPRTSGGYMNNVNVYGNVFQGQSGWLFDLGTGGSNSYFYDNVVNSTTLPASSVPWNLNLSTVGNTWANPAGTGYSNTCLSEDGLVCYYPYTVGSATDYYPVALSGATPQGLSAFACPGPVYPNEDNLPAPAKFQLSFNVFNFAGYTTPSIDNILKSTTNAVGDETTCSYVAHDANNRTYTCNVSMNYWYPSDAYDANVTFVQGAATYAAEQANLCNYGQLLASQRTQNNIAFSDAAPGITDSQSDNPITIRNTGNVDFNLSLTAHNLEGRSTPSIALPASAFKAGASLGTAVPLANGVAKDLDMTIAAAQNAQDDIWFWLSMPATQAIQDYYAPEAWTVTTS